MTEGVTQDIAPQEEQKASLQGASDKARENFARLEAAKQAEREARIRAEMEREHLRQQLEQIREAQKPAEPDPLDGVEDYVDKERLQRIREKDRAAFKKEAEEIANRTYEARKREEEKRNYLGRLRSEYSDYDKVMDEKNIAQLEQVAPAFLQRILKIEDDYDRRAMTYEFLKSRASQPVSEERPSIKQKVEENQQNPYYIPAGTGTPAAVEFDIKSKTARDQAYQKLKAAQRRPIGNATR